MARKRIDKVKWTGFPNNNADALAIKTAIDQTHSIIAAIETEKSSLTDIFQELHEKYGMPRRIFNFLVKSSYFGNQEMMFEKNEELKEAWEAYEAI